ncbi:MAG: tetratricopeptide repeat protein [Cytophagales bacterium]|nr:tetratricopeptide repeat protein [Cytophagales bacterium]
MICLNERGIRERTQGDYLQAEEKHKAALEIARNIDDRFLISVSLDNLGVVYRRLDNIERALECHLESLDISRMTRHQIRYCHFIKQHW